MTDNHHLLAEYVRSGSDAAFRELVSRYVDLVHSAAFRMVGGDKHRAQDVAQTVFVDLARMARTLPGNVKLGGWLHRHTCFVAANLMRCERRRLSRERHFVEMNTPQDHPDADYSLVAPLLDEAINTLGGADRTAIQLRFFERHDFRDVGRAIGSSEDAARMRVARALEKLETLLKRQGITSTAASLGVVLSANAVQAAPVGLATTISTAALAASTLAATSSATAIHAITMTTLQKSAIAATLAIAGGWLGIQYHALANVENANDHLREQLAAVRSSDPTAATPRTKPAAPARHSKAKATPDWKYIAAQFVAEQQGGAPDRSALLRFEKLLLSMTKEDLVAALDEIAAIHLSADARSGLEVMLIVKLTLIDPELALTSSVDRLREYNYPIQQQLASSLGAWAKKDLAGAVAWFDQQIAEGKFESKSLDGVGSLRNIFEGAFIAVLSSSDIDAAAHRLGALPPDQRGLILRFSFNSAVNVEDQAVVAQLVRDQVPANDQSETFAALASQVAMNGGYPKVTEYLDRIRASAVERSACAEQAAIANLKVLSNGRKVTIDDLDNMRAWVRSQDPDSADRVTGDVLGNQTAFQVMTFDELSALAVHYQEASSNDNVLFAFLSSSLNMHQPSEKIRALAGKIGDENRRNEILEKLK